MVFGAMTSAGDLESSTSASDTDLTDEATCAHGSRSPVK